MSAVILSNADNNNSLEKYQPICNINVSRDECVEIFAND